MDRDNINSSFRDDRGRFIKGFKTKDLPIEYKIKKGSYIAVYKNKN